MALIWAEGFTGDKALALLWRRYALASARADDRTLPAAELGAAVIEQRAAEAAYEAAVKEAEEALAATATGGKARAHVLVIGVGRYDGSGIPALTTSVRGAWAFTDWMLTRFHNADCPLGSVELVLSPGETLGDWKPSPEAAKRLGLTDGTSTDTLPVEAAKFANIKAAFDRWLKRAGTHADNAAFFYFSGHGLWKDGPLLLPEDAQLATNTQPFERLIDIQRTEKNMFNAQPSIQCFFIDACQEITSPLLQNLAVTPGDPLHRPTNAAAILNRDPWIYIGSRIGRKAFGPENDAPFFTQELLACLERRGAGESIRPDTWVVTTASLKRALELASLRRREIDADARQIRFSFAPGVSDFTARLCQIQGRPEVFVIVSCEPDDTMGSAKLYVESQGVRNPRPNPLPSEWYTTVAQGDCLAGVEFEAAAALSSTPMNFVANPPFITVELVVKPQAPEGE